MCDTGKITAQWAIEQVVAERTLFQLQDRRHHFSECVVLANPPVPSDSLMYCMLKSNGEYEVTQIHGDDGTLLASVVSKPRRKDSFEEGQKLLGKSLLKSKPLCRNFLQ